MINSYYGFHFVRCCSCDRRFIIEKYNEWDDSNLCDNCTIERIKSKNKQADRLDIYFIGGPLDGKKDKLKVTHDCFMYYATKYISQDEVKVIKHLYEKKDNLGEWVLFEYGGVND